MIKTLKTQMPANYLQGAVRLESTSKALLGGVLAKQACF
jgi:hypothetical protein